MESNKRRMRERLKYNTQYIHDCQTLQLWAQRSCTLLQHHFVTFLLQLSDLLLHMHMVAGSLQSPWNWSYSCMKVRNSEYQQLQKPDQIAVMTGISDRWLEMPGWAEMLAVLAEIERCHMSGLLLPSEDVVACPQERCEHTLHHHQDVPCSMLLTRGTQRQMLSSSDWQLMSWCCYQPQHTTVFTQCNMDTAATSNLCQ